MFNTLISQFFPESFELSAHSLVFVVVQYLIHCDFNFTGLSKRSQFIKEASFLLKTSAQYLENAKPRHVVKINKSRVEHFTPWAKVCYRFMGTHVFRVWDSDFTSWAKVCYRFMGIHVTRVWGSGDDRVCMSANIFVWCFLNYDLMSDSRNLLKAAATRAIFCLHR